MMHFISYGRKGLTCLLGLPLPVIVVEHAPSGGKGEGQADVGHWLHTFAL